MSPQASRSGPGPGSVRGNTAPDLLTETQARQLADEDSGWRGRP